MAPIRSIHEIHLTVEAQLYTTVVGQTMTTFVDNTGIMTYYEVQHLTPDELEIYDENQRIEKE